jgi:hypothetical protein
MKVYEHRRKRQRKLGTGGQRRERRPCGVYSKHATNNNATQDLNCRRGNSGVGDDTYALCAATEPAAELASVGHRHGDSTGCSPRPAPAVGGGVGGHVASLSPSKKKYNFDLI